MSSQKRKDRLKQLEKERDHFYLNRNSHLVSSSDRPDSSEEDCYANDMIYSKLQISKGKHAFAEPKIENLPEPNVIGKGKSSVKTQDHLKNLGIKDQFEKLMVKETKSRLQTDKQILEQERQRNQSLEQSYEKLLNQVQQLQNTHLQDLRNSEQRFHSASSALQKALVSKAEELVTMSNKLASSESRYERDSREWAKERVSLLSQVDLFAQKEAEMTSRLVDREKRLSELNSLRKELAERIATREQELIKYGKALREREGDFSSEKETRVKLEIKLLKLEQELEKRDNEFRDVQVAYQRKQVEAEDLAATKLQLNEMKRDLEDLQRRERHYVGELDQLSARERKLYKQNEDLLSQDRKYQQQLTIVNEKNSNLVTQLEEAKQKEEKMNQDLALLQQQNKVQEEQILKFDKLTYQYQQDSSKIVNDFTTLQHQCQELKITNQSLAKELSTVKEQETGANRDKDMLQQKVLQLSKDLSTKQRELDIAAQEVKELSERLEHEIAQQQDYRIQNKEKFASVTQKITELQDTLQETQQQLQELRQNEKNVRNVLKQKEDTLKAQSQALIETEGRIQELINTSSKDHIEFESFKNKKRDEILSLQDKYAHAKQAMDQEVNQLRFQFNQRQAQFNAALEEISELKSELADYSTLKLSLETRVAELVASEGSQSRQIATLQASLNQKQQELNRLLSKNTALADHTKRLDDELQLYRENNSQARDSDISKLQSNMEEISKRLKSQVDQLLDKDSVTEQSHSRSASMSTTSSVKPKYTVSTAISGSPKIAKFADPNDDEEFEQIEKLFNRTAFLKSTN